MARITEQDLLDELTARYYRPLVAPGEITAEILAERLEITKHQAGVFLKLEEKAGRMVAHNARNEAGRPVLAYRRI